MKEMRNFEERRKLNKSLGEVKGGKTEDGSQGRKSRKDRRWEAEESNRWAEGS
jgi:hypothetical protein